MIIVKVYTIHDYLWLLYSPCEITCTYINDEHLLVFFYFCEVLYIWIRVIVHQRNLVW